MNETLADLAEDLRGRRVQFALGGLGFGALAVWLISEPSYGVPSWATAALVAVSVTLFVSSWVFYVVDRT
jgi:hypothetical protein